MNNPGLIYLGSFRVDSGQTIIGDSCYLAYLNVIK